MLMTIAAIIAVLWLLGLVAGIGGGLIHLLLVVALAVFLYDMLVGRRRTHV
jgi:K+-transporting ATPase A subunit